MDTFVELSEIDSDLRALLKASPGLAKGHEDDVGDLIETLYLPRRPTKDEWDRALRQGAGV
jgi:hypothetical protein